MQTSKPSLKCSTFKSACWIMMHRLLERCCVWSVQLTLLRLQFPSFCLLNCSSQTVCLVVLFPFFSLFHCLNLFLFSPCSRLTGRHNSRCLVMVLKTYLLHDGRLASPRLHPFSFAVFFSSDSSPSLFSSTTSGFWWDSSCWVEPEW